MRLKRLELQGFKSFLDRTILTFEPGITGVVGPNGCGKSNIVDAIQWVMGEQSAKHLRGDSMTDVIFNGSDSKAAMSMAEVSLILDKQGVGLSAQFAAFEKGDEIAVTRRVYRDGTGEYLINKTPCRLKDIHELFMDTGVGRRAYSIIEQGQIDRMINVKPEERRHLFEEVAGITKYKAKRKEAEKKLEATRGNMVRLQDIIGELEKQIRSLKIQATRARKYKELKGELEAVDLFLLGRNLFNHKKAIDELGDRRNHLVTERSESDAQFGETDAKLTELEILRLDQEKAHQALSEKERDLSLLIQRLESQLGLFEERKKHLLSNHESNIAEEKEASDTVNSLTEEIGREQEERDSVGEALSLLENEIVESEQRVREKEEERTRAVRRKDQLLDKKTELSHRRVTFESQAQHAEQKQNEFGEARTEIERKTSENIAVMESHRVALSAADAKIENCATRSGQAEQEVASLHTEVQEISAKLSTLEETLYQTREEYHAQHSRLESLKELQENLEGYSPTAREILLRLEGTSVSAIPLAEVLQPEADIEDHLEMLLGLDMNTLLVKTTEEAESLAKMITERGLERVRILALSELGERAVLSREIDGTVPLLSKIRITEGYQAAANWWLGNTYLCDGTEKLFQERRLHPDVTFLTKDSKTVGHADRSPTSGNPPTSTGVFARRREIEHLGVVASGLDQKLNTLNSERENVLQHLQSQERLHGELKDKLSSIHIESVEYRKEREKVQIEVSRAERDAQSLRHESERNLRQIEEVKAQSALITEGLAQIMEGEIALMGELETAEFTIQTTAKEFETTLLSINDKKIEKSRLGERVNSLDYKLEKLKSEVDTLSERCEQLLEQRAQDEKELSNIDESKLEVIRQKETSNEEKNATLVRLSDTKNAFNETTTELQVLREKRAELQKKRDEILNEIQELELKITHEQSSYEHLVGISTERYQREATPFDETHQMDLAATPLFVENLSVEWAPLPENEKRALLEEHLKSMREKIGRYGEVNLTAIHEFDEIQKRYEFLTEQKVDLEKSIAILEEAILKIDETTKFRFQETFEAVNHKFKEIFPILFNGGKAELTLVTQENSTDTGVDIMVQPPGKRLQSITLLSGGEKALTAVSLVLAIFARKPSPFCLLDEVDAPLDDANVSRFNTVIRKMSEKTQFIVITHNKKTMEIAEALYGVTMERAGISKMTSVRLN